MATSITGVRFGDTLGKLAGITRERYELNGEMGQMMTERFNVSGALLVKLFGRPQHESDSFSDSAGRVRDIGVTQAMYSRVFMSSLGLLASLRHQNVKIQIYNPSEDVQEVLETTHLNQILEICHVEI